MALDGMILLLLVRTASSQSFFVNMLKQAAELMPESFITVTFLYGGPDRDMTNAERALHEETFGFAWNNSFYDEEAIGSFASISLKKVELTQSNYLPDIVPGSGRRLNGRGGGAHCSKNYGCRCPPTDPGSDAGNGGGRSLQGVRGSGGVQARRRLTSFNEEYCNRIKASSLDYFQTVTHCESYFCVNSGDSCEEKLAVEYADIFVFAPWLTWLYGRLTTDVGGEVSH